MELFLDESYCKKNLEPFTLTRHTSDIRIGIMTIREKWQLLCGPGTLITSDKPSSASTVKIPANLIPNPGAFEQIISFYSENDCSVYPDFAEAVHYPWELFLKNQRALLDDFICLTNNRITAPINQTNHLICPDNIFIEEGAVVNHSMLNAENGPIYIGRNATVMEGSLIRGPFALLDNGTVKMGAKIYGATTIGRFSVAGGEIKNSVLFDYSNKAHDGYLGDSVIGSWCNLGAGSSNSNVKNTGGEVSYMNRSGVRIKAGNKAGLIMGDYSRCAINTSFYTGTQVGICCNLFGKVCFSGQIPDFTWGEEPYLLDKAIRDISNWKRMKQQLVTEADIQMLKNIYPHKSTT